MPTIALFGTSADPPHQGHGTVLSWLATQADHVAVWTANNPFKNHQTPLADRFRMLELLIESLGLPPGQVQVHAELGHRRSVVSIERAQQRWPGADLWLVIGADLVEQLPRWYRADDIFAAVTVLVVPRPGYPLTPERMAPLQRRARVRVADLPQLVEAASSRYRDTATQDLPSPIQAYIAQHGLYSCPENSTKTLPTP